MRAIIALIASLLATAAAGHDAADWINRGGYRNAVGELCCGERDCAQLSEGDVSLAAGGYRIRSLGETVPSNEALPSPDGRYWHCAWGGERKCFFAPVMGF